MECEWEHICIHDINMWHLSSYQVHVRCLVTAPKPMLCESGENKSSLQSDFDIGISLKHVICMMNAIMIFRGDATKKWMLHAMTGTLMNGRKVPHSYQPWTIKKRLLPALTTGIYVQCFALQQSRLNKKRVNEIPVS